MVNLLLSAAAVAEQLSTDSAVGTWTMVDVTDATQHGDAHLIEVGERVVLIDAGPYNLGRSRLVSHLKDKGIDRIDVAFVSHAHVDHYGGIRALIEAGIAIGRVEISLPDAEVCRREIPWGCKQDDIRLLLSVLREEGIPVAEPIASVDWDLGDASIELVERLDADDPEIGTIDVNDTSMVLRLDVGDTSVLFTGDLNTTSGRYLATRDLGLRPNVLLKVPHHGAESLAPDEFFAAVDPDFAFVPAMAAVWRSDRSRRTREWLESRHIPTFVSGENGDVTVHFGEHLRIMTERR